MLRRQRRSKADLDEAIYRLIEMNERTPGWAPVTVNSIWAIADDIQLLYIKETVNRLRRSDRIVAKSDSELRQEKILADYPVYLGFAKRWFMTPDGYVRQQQRVAARSLAPAIMSDLVELRNAQLAALRELAELHREDYRRLVEQHIKANTTLKPAAALNRAYMKDTIEALFADNGSVHEQ